MKETPWDVRLARLCLVPVLSNKKLTPNHFTLLRLLTGIFAAGLFALGEDFTEAAFIFALSNFIDHFDGEYARLTNSTSKFGHFFDLLSDFIVTVSTFICIGIGLNKTGTDILLVAQGVIAGVSVTFIFYIRYLIETQYGKISSAQPSLAGFEAEDILYMLPLVTYFEQTKTFLLLSALGAPIGAILVYIQFVKLKRKENNL